MANMELIEAKTLTTTTANITFSAIPATYTDLCIVVSARSSVGANEDGVWISQINGSGSNLTNKWLRGSGSSVLSSDSALYGIYVGQVNGATATANSFGNFSIYITDYASANYKSISIDGAQERNATESYMGFTSGLWSNSAAITSITLDTQVGDFVQYSTAYLYGVSNANVGAKATGGVIYSDGSYFYHTFTSTGVFTPTTTLSCDYLIVGGGGGGGWYTGGGGGAGGLVYQTAQTLTATAYTATVGAGGSGAPGGSNNAGANGTDSSFNSKTATGGGRGGVWGATYPVGADGGSGGGAAENSGAQSGGASNQNSYSGTGFGNAGGSSFGASPFCGGGGGGAGQVGYTGTAAGGGAGGNGKQYVEFSNATGTGVSGYYAGGGGAANGINGGGNQGGLGGGGTGTLTTGEAGGINTGGGGGAGSTSSSTGGAGGAGGSGLVIVRYAI